MVPQEPCSKPAAGTYYSQHLLQNKNKKCTANDNSGVSSTHLITQSQENHHLLPTCAWHSCSQGIWLKPKPSPIPAFPFNIPRRINPPPPHFSLTQLPKCPLTAKVVLCPSGNCTCTPQSSYPLQRVSFKVWGVEERGNGKENG